jgi:transposase
VALSIANLFTGVEKPMIMNAVGIDISKGKSTVCIRRPGEVVLAKPFDVKHNAVSLQGLAERLCKLDGETRIVMEHTGRYYEVAAKVLHDNGLFVSAVNPILIANYGEYKVHGVKTDNADADKIARFALDRWGLLREYSGMDTIRYNLKTLNRQFQLASKQRTAFNNNLVDLLEQTFPTLRKLFESPVRADGTQKWVDFAETFWHADCVRKLSLNAFTEKYLKWCRKHGYNFSAEKAAAVHSAAKELVVLVLKTEINKFMIQQATRQLTFISQSVESYRAQMLNLASQLPEFPVVMAMYGTGNSLGPQLMAELGDVRRFKDKHSLAAFAGIDPTKNDSGQKNSRKNKTTKRGSPYLRRTLFLIMTILIQKAPVDDPVYQFMDKKRAEGKDYYVYMTAAANKFLRCYYGKVREYLKEQGLWDTLPVESMNTFPNTSGEPKIGEVNPVDRGCATTPCVTR